MHLLEGMETTTDDLFKRLAQQMFFKAIFYLSE